MSKNSKKSLSQKSGDQRGRLVLQSAHAGGKKDSIISVHSNTVGPHQGGAIFQSSQRIETAKELQKDLTMTHQEIRELEEDSSIEHSGFEKQLLNESTSFRRFMKRQNQTSRYSEDFEFENLKE